MSKGNNTVDCGGGLEFYVSPNVVTNDNREERTLKLQLQMNQLKTQQAKENIEIIPRAPSIVLSPEGTKQLLAANEAAAQRSQARREQEGSEMIPRAPAIIMRDKQSFEIEDKLARRPSVFIPVDPSLKTAQRVIEEIPLAPAILLKGNEAKSATRKPKVPRIVHNVLCTQSHTINNGDDELWH